MTVAQRQYLYLTAPSSPLTVRSLPGEDSWDRWNDQRDHYLYADVPTYHHVPANIALVSGDLDSYGDWHVDATTVRSGCRAPRHAHWRPYADGHWCWVEPYGWTWVADDPWGWAPYHYGTWVDEPYGWAWCPGPVNQYWSPAVVSFSDYNGSVCWAPLAPVEVRYPASPLRGIHGGAWSVFFSIGQAGCYYPAGPTTVWAAFNNVYVNRVTYVNNVTNITNVYDNYAGIPRFVPRNARFAAGRHSQRPQHSAGAAPIARRSTPRHISRGRLVAALSAGRAPIFGPGQPANPMGWLLIFAGLFENMFAFATAYVVFNHWLGHGAQLVLVHRAVVRERVLGPRIDHRLPSPAALPRRRRAVPSVAGDAAGVRDRRRVGGRLTVHSRHDHRPRS